MSPINSHAPARRRFLKAAGVAGGAAVAAGVAAVPFTDHGELDKDFPDIKENQVILPPNGKHVLIVGGGLSGLQAAVELSARGFKVTVLERSATPGGKLKSWRDKHFGPADDPNKSDPAFPGYIREHGVHAVWGFYHNLREFLGRYGWPLSNTPKDVSMYNFYDKDQRKSHVPRTSWVPPYDKVQLVDYLVHLGHLNEEDRLDAMRLIRRLLSFDYTDPKQRAYLDSMTVEQYCKKLGLSDALTYKLCDCVLEMAFYDNVQTASILSLGLLVQVWGGTPRDFQHFNLYVNPTNESFLTPMVNFIRSHHGDVLYNHEVTDFIMDGVKRIVGVKAAPVPRNVIKRCSICGGLIFDGMEVGHECPYCGANAENLRAIAAHERTERTFAADFVVCALDGPAAMQLVGQNIDALGGGDYFRNILKLHTAAPHVVNLWYQGRGYWEKHVLDDKQRPALCVYPTGFTYLGITINRSIRIKGGDGTGWAWSQEYTDRDITIIETQPAKAHLLSGDTKAIAMACHEELKIMMPNLPEPQSWYVNRWFNYTNYQVGDEGNRPATQSPVDNLFFIGDISFVPQHCVYMEKTNVSAKWVTNLILDKIGQSTGKITILPSGTPSLSTDLARLTGSVYLPGDAP
jgi:isorenieratene synthase